MAELLKNSDEEFAFTHLIISRGLTGLINSNQENKDVLRLLSSFSKNFLPIFFNQCKVATGDNRATYLAAVAAFAQISENDLVNNLFKRVLKKLLEETTKVCFFCFFLPFSLNVL